MDLRSPVNIVARYEIWPDLIDDFWGLESALMSRIKDRIVPFTGGTFTKSVFRFRPLPAAFYKIGATHNITKVTTLGEMNFGIKFARCSIAEFKEELEVFAKGENAVFSLLDEDLENGMSSLLQHVTLMMWGGGVSDDSVITGFDELIGDGILPSWNGVVATSYGGVARNGSYGSRLNGHIIWAGNPDGTAGPINFPVIDYGIDLASRGQIRPNLAITSKRGLSYVRAKLEPQNRYTGAYDTIDPYFGGAGLYVRGLYIMSDELIPSAGGLTDAENYGLGNYKTGTITNPVLATKNYFPVAGDAANLEVGEIMFGCNTDLMVMRMSDSAEWGFGFSGFMGAPNTEKVAGSIKFAGNIQGIPLYNFLIYGFNS